MFCGVVMLLFGGQTTVIAQATRDAGEASSERAAAEPLIRPRVLNDVPARYPPAALETGLESEVELLVTVRQDGKVGEVEVIRSGGPAFDRAAEESIRQWRFAPATLGGRAVSSRIRVPFVFRPPTRPPKAAAAAEATPQAEAGSAQTGSAQARSAQAGTTEEQAIEITVRGSRELRTETRSSGDFLLDRQLIRAAPRREGADVLLSAPGVFVGRGEGPAVAHNYMLRGFDAEHGQDIAFRVAGLPINLPSHIHGQGYADLGFLIGETVDKVQVREGVHDPRQGDFAVAGSIDIELALPQAERGVQWLSSYGSFNTRRYLALWADPATSPERFGAVHYISSDGFGENRRSQSASGVLQGGFELGRMRYRGVVFMHSVHAQLAGVVREDDVEQGHVCYDCVYPYPTAQAQNAQVSRVMAGLFGAHRGARGSNGEVGVWLGQDHFRLQQNFTGFLQASSLLADVAGRGDLIEQQNHTSSLGITGRYRTAPLRTKTLGRGTVELGLDARMDQIEQAQYLIDASVRNQTWDHQVDASIRAVDVGSWVDVDWRFSPLVSARAGVRNAALAYDVDDRLGNVAALNRPQDSFLRGFRRSAAGSAWGPRVSLAVTPLAELTLLAAYGEGYRSPQARLLEDGEQAPFAKVYSSDVGLQKDWGKAHRLKLGFYQTELSDDVSFDPAEGRLENIGATARSGVVLQAIARAGDWLVASFSLTTVEAKLLEPPPPSAEEPAPPFVRGQQLPFVAPLVLRGDLAFQRAWRRKEADTLLGKGSLGYSHLAGRPLPYQQFSPPLDLLDGSLGLEWRRFAVTLEGYNLLDKRYSAVEYIFPSDWSPNDGLRSRVPARHLSAGTPRSWALALSVRF